MTRIIAPICPYLAEEIHATWNADGRSIFMTPWVPLVRITETFTIKSHSNGFLQSLEWKDPEVSKDMEILLRLRGTVLSLLEKARKAKFVVFIS